MTSPLAGVRALLLDLEGTLYQAKEPIAGAAKALEALAARRIPHCFITNTTSRPRSALVAELAAMGFPVPPERIFTAPRAAREYLLAHGLDRCHLLVRPAVLEDLAGIREDDVLPGAVVVGDMGEDFTYARLNRAFRLLLQGAELITLARNRYYRAADGLVLDQGPFVVALENASGRQATLVGKPSISFFQSALKLLGVSPSEAAVVGDDLEADVGGGQAAGMRGILVRTGKFREDELERSTVRPDAVLDYLADLPPLL
ncbi:MAG: TIGR01458 family HAD-type hydrolase [Thermoanaerobaculia bacterium]